MQIALIYKRWTIVDMPSFYRRNRITGRWIAATEHFPRIHCRDVNILHEACILDLLSTTK
jgi:hypothetical protein